MDHSQNHLAPNQPAGGNLNIAVDRLDRALEALEARVRALQAGEPLPEFSGTEVTGSAANDAYERVLADLEEARTSNAELAAAATAAHAALGAAAADIRQLVSGVM